MSRAPGNGDGAAAEAPRSADLPADCLLLDGPETVESLGGPQAVLERVRAVLERPGPAVVVSTSGSTGRPKRTVLTAEGLRASGEATAAVTGGHGHWLLCLPAHYVAGLQVLARSALAGTEPVAMGPGSFTAAGFMHAVERMPGGVRHASLVPTQLDRLVHAIDAPSPEDPDPERTRAALGSLTSVLLGGSAAAPALLERARALGARVVTTYGSSETCGGCVYDGAPLPGMRVRLEPLPDAQDEASGRIWLGGASVTPGYLDDPHQTAAHIRALDGLRWYRTDDHGVLARAADGAERLQVLGRLDDVINTGGVKVSAGRVAACLLEDPRVRQALVTAVPHPEWGQAPAAALAVGALAAASADEQQALRAELSARLRCALGAPAIPRTWLLLDELPQLPTGKPDRRALIARLAESSGAV